MKSVLCIFSVFLMFGTSQDGPQFFERISEMYENVLSRSARFLLPVNYINDVNYLENSKYIIFSPRVFSGFHFNVINT